MILLALCTAFAACDDDKPDTPEQIAAKADCKHLLEHIVSISPQGEGQDPKAVVDGLPIEDLQACMATEGEIRACMGAATTVAAVRKCPLQFACAQKAKKAKKPEIAAKCDSDEHAADALEVGE
jgi:hypothetical protein